MKSYASNPLPLDRSRIPEPVFDQNPDWVEFYWKAWELAWDHVIHRPGAPASPYMDEGFDPDTIWIWDTCFMVHFCKYAPDVFPGIASFDNFYGPLHRGGTHAPGGISTLAAERTPFGYHWNGISSGMDNTPRGRGDYRSILWFDLLAQQGLAALHIAHLAGRIGREDIAADYMARHAALKQLANRYYWNEADGTYYDILADDNGRRIEVPVGDSAWDAASAEALHPGTH